jgi:two-component system, LuxR family, response regulator FixJ
MTEATAPVVYLVDDNQPFRRSTALLLETSGMEVRDFDTAAQMLEHLEQGASLPCGACIVSDIRMPGLSGLELLEELRRRKCELPFIFITAHGDVPLAVEAMRRGAVNFIEKPFAAEVLVEAIRLAAIAEPASPEAAPVARPQQPNPKLAVLTRRERQVLDLVVSGRFNKTIADVLGISTKTVELHRASVMVKLGVRNVPDLVKVYLGYE